MLRRRCIYGVRHWEVVSVSEPMCVSDVRGVLLSLHRRGLRDPCCYRVLSRAEMGDRETAHASPCNTEVVSTVHGSLPSDATNTTSFTQQASMPPDLHRKEDEEQSHQRPQEAYRRMGHRNCIA